MYEILERLACDKSASSLSGNEAALHSAIESYFEEKAERDSLDNLIIKTSGKGQGILLDAHADKIGMKVTYITNEGFLKIAPCGGVDTRVLRCCDVLVHGKKDIFGVVTSVPPHLTKDGEGDKTDISDISVDIGMKKDEAEKIVSPGDSITFVNYTGEMMNSRLTQSALDNRAGVAVLIRVYQKLKENNINANVTYLFSSQEEAGLRGAAAASAVIATKQAIAVDVSFATAPGIDRREAGEMGKGPMICLSSTLDREMSDKMFSLAKKYNIPCQTEVCAEMTGTNADKIGISAGGKKTGLVSVPIRNMHTPSETVSPEDIENSAELIFRYIESMVKGNE